MKRRILFLLFILAFLIDYGIAPVLAEENKDTLEIKEVVEAYFINFNHRDIDSAMRLVSANYSDTDVDGNVIDYAKFKLNLENMINLKNYTDRSIGEYKIYNLRIQDNKATFWVTYTVEGLNLDTLIKESRKQKRVVTLVKENGVWKIVKWRHPR